MTSAMAHKISRRSPSARPPVIQNTADIDSQIKTRIAFIRARGRVDGVEATPNSVRPTCIAAYAAANHNPLSSKAFGIEVESTSPPSINRNSRIRTGVSSGLNQLVIQEV